MRHPLRAVLATAVLSAAACRPAAAAIPAPLAPPDTAAPRPTLVVFITVDQLRTDYLTARFGDQLTGGLKRLLGGAFFVKGMQDHAITETAPGHASTMSGRFPVHTGIVMNSLGVNTPDYPLLGVRGPGAAPTRFKGTTLTDWLLAADRRTKVLSVSRKDRGAILPIGRSKQAVFWYSDGNFTSSRYYYDSLPEWVQRFDAEAPQQAYAGAKWDLLLPPSAYPEPDSVPQENQGRTITLPKALPDDPDVAARVLPGFPFMDDLIATFALRGVREMRLGLGPQTDLLAVSFSTLDAVGHAYGPDSREVHDMVLRLDRTIGAFLDSLYAMRDSTRIIVALTGDHGVAPVLGVRSRDPSTGARIVDLSPALREFTDALRTSGVDSLQVSLDDGVLVVAPEVLARAPKDLPKALDRFLAAARRTPGILRADRMTDFAGADTVTDVIARRWLHMFDPRGTNVVAVATLAPYCYWTSTISATHGTPHPYDADVPVLFYGAGVRPGRHDSPARTVDMAPTLAALLRVRPTEALDGVVLREALRQP